MIQASLSLLSRLKHNSRRCCWVLPHPLRGSSNRRLLSLQSLLLSSSTSGGGGAEVEEVKVVEVGPRDGLQNERTVVPSASEKIELVKRLHMAGCTHIEAGSFVSPKWVPSMADSDLVMQGLHEWRTSSATTEAETEDLVLSCLVPNPRGLEAAIRYRADEIAVFGSASEAFAHKNLGCSIEESFERFRAVIETAKEVKVDRNGGGRPLKIRGYVSCVIACPYDGAITPSQVARVTENMLDLGCHEVSLGDTIGIGTPASTLAMLKAVQEAVGGSYDSSALAVHFHDTYGQALANILVSLERGISTVDASVAGLGGCPYAKGASGNVATEDVVYMLNGMGVKTGIDLDRLVDAGEFICRVLQQKSRSRAGTAILANRQRQKDES